MTALSPYADSRAPSPRPLRVLQVAFACDPDRSMESRNGWRRALHAARRHDVTVLCGDAAATDRLNELAGAEGLADRLRFVSIDPGFWGRRLSNSATTYYAGYRLWHRAAYRMAQSMHDQAPFDLVHQTTFCGYREPGYCWRLKAPFVWGPVGGTQSFPLRYLGQLGSIRSAWIEVCRNVVNAAQLRLSSRVRGATRRSAVLLTATQRARDDFQQALGVDSLVHLETGVEGPCAEPRTPRTAGEPFRILWAGRLRPWKTLPLLLRALALLPPSLDYRVRVLGAGPSETAWRRLADRLGVADRIEWVGWPPYQETLPHYRWADAFVFTSMRDTSGTGLLESLAAGTPVVGVDHQGCADLVHDGCGVRAPVDSPRRTIEGLADGLAQLARDRLLWTRLSDGARAEAQRYAWETQAETLLRWYDRAVASAAAPARTAAPVAPPARLLPTPLDGRPSRPPQAGAIS